MSVNFENSLRGSYTPGGMRHGKDPAKPRKTDMTKKASDKYVQMIARDAAAMRASRNDRPPELASDRAARRKPMPTSYYQTLGQRSAGFDRASAARRRDGLTQQPDSLEAMLAREKHQAMEALRRKTGRRTDLTTFGSTKGCVTESLQGRQRAHAESLRQSEAPIQKPSEQRPFILRAAATTSEDTMSVRSEPSPADSLSEAPSEEEVTPAVADAMEHMIVTTEIRAFVEGLAGAVVDAAERSQEEFLSMYVNAAAPLSPVDSEEDPKEANAANLNVFEQQAAVLRHMKARNKPFLVFHPGADLVDAVVENYEIEAREQDRKRDDFYYDGFTRARSKYNMEAQKDAVRKIENIRSRVEEILGNHTETNEEAKKAVRKFNQISHFTKPEPVVQHEAKSVENLQVFSSETDLLQQALFTPSSEEVGEQVEAAMQDFQGLETPAEDLRVIDLDGKQQLAQKVEKQATKFEQVGLISTKKHEERLSVAFKRLQESREKMAALESTAQEFLDKQEELKAIRTDEKVQRMCDQILRIIDTIPNTTETNRAMRAQLQEVFEKNSKHSAASRELGMNS